MDEQRADRVDHVQDAGACPGCGAPHGTSSVLIEAASALIERTDVSPLVKRHHKARERIRRILRPQPAAALPRSWHMLERAQQSAVADAITEEALRPRMPRWWKDCSGGRMRFSTLTPRDVIKLVDAAVAQVGVDGARLVVAADHAFGDGLRLWALPVLFTPEAPIHLLLWDEARVRGELEPDEDNDDERNPAEDVRILRDILGALWRGEDPPQADATFVEIVADRWLADGNLDEPDGDNGLAEFKEHLDNLVDEDDDGLDEAVAPVDGGGAGDVARVEDAAPPGAPEPRHGAAAGRDLAAEVDVEVAARLTAGTAAEWLAGLADVAAAVLREASAAIAAVDTPRATIGERFDAVLAAIHRFEAGFDAVEIARGALDPQAAPARSRGELAAAAAELAERIAAQGTTAAWRVALLRLAAVESLADSAEAAAAALRVAAEQAVGRLDTLADVAIADDVAALVELVALLDTPREDIDYAAVPALHDRLPASVRPYLALATSGLLSLPPPDPSPTAERFAATRSTDSADAAPQLVGSDAVLAEEEASTGPADAGQPSAALDAAGDRRREQAAAAEPAESTSTDTTESASETTAPAAHVTESDAADVTAPARSPQPTGEGGTSGSPGTLRRSGPAAAPAPTAPAPAEAATPDGGEEDRKPPRFDPAEVTAALARTLRAGRFSAAHWITRLGGLDATAADVTELLVYAAQLRRMDGPLTTAFDDVAARTDLDAAAGIAPLRPLLLAAALRAGLVTPYVANATLSKIAPHFEAQPATSAIIDAAVHAAREGVRVGADAPVVMRTAPDVAQPLDRLAAAAAELIEQAPYSRLVYEGASAVYRHWMDRDTGLLGNLLADVADKRTDQRKTIAGVLADLRRNLPAKIDATDRDIRGRLAPGIDATARMQLIHRGETALDLLEEWAAADDDHGLESYLEQQVDTLRRAVASHRDAAFDELADAASGDELAEAAVAAARRLLGELFDRVTEGRPLTGLEPDPRIAANRALLRVVTLPLDTNTLAPDLDKGEHPPAEALDQLANPMPHAEAFRARSVAGFHDEASVLLRGIEAVDSETATTLAAERDVAVREAHARGKEHWTRARRKLDTARAQGYLDVAQSGEMERRLEAAKVSDERLDIGRAQREIDKLVADIDAARDAAIIKMHDELAVEAASSSAVAANAERIRERIDDGDLAVARDWIWRSRSNHPLDEDRQDPCEVTRAFSAVLGELAATPFTTATVAAVAQGAVHGPLSYAALPEGLRERATAAAGAYMTLSSKDKSNLTASALQSLLRGLGLEMAGEVRRLDVAGSTQHVWREVTTAAPVAAAVPQFGSERRGRFLLLITWPGTSPAKLVDLAVTQGHRQPVVAIHLGQLTPAERDELAVLCGPDQNNAPLIVLDAALIAYRLAQPDDQWASTLRLALPYSAVNPFIPDSPELPPEMFFGRREELDRIMDLRGTCVLYGGRKLGKSALLREATRLYNARGKGSVAVYIDADDHKIGRPLPPEELWSVLHPLLEHKAIPMVSATGAKQAEAAVREGVLRWLEADRTRELLICIDECDHMLDADDNDGEFPVVRALRGINQASDSRCKPVFAGLHQVQRFQRHGNHPFAHLGRPIAIGGLSEKAAYDLIHDPLAALGFEFEPAVISRILAYTNLHPALLQVFGFELVRHLLRTRRAGAPPWTATFDDVEVVATDETTRRAIRDKFVDTINLDPRYELIAYTLGLHDVENGYGSRLTQDGLRELCEVWEWPGLETEDRAGEEFRGLLDEMVDLGVLVRPEPGVYAMRSPTVTQLLGDRDRLYELLEKFHTRKVAATHSRVHYRRTFTGRRSVAYPLTEGQLNDLTEPRDALRAVLSTPALRGEDLHDALVEAVDNRDGTKVTAAPQLTRRKTPTLPQPKSRGHRLLVVDLRGAGREKIEHAFAHARTLLGQPHPGSVGIALHLAAGELDAWEELLAQRGTPAEVPLVALRRWTAEGLELWARGDSGVTLPAPSDVERVLAATGGWPSLVDAAVTQVLATTQRTLPDAAEALREQLDPAEFCAAIGLGDLPGITPAVWRLLVELTSEGDGENLETFVELAAGELDLPGQRGREAVARAVTLLHTLGVADKGDGAVRTEPVAAAAWREARVPAEVTG